MERRLAGVGLGLCVMFLAAGCEDQNKKTKTDSQASSDYGMDYMSPDSTTSTYDTGTTSDPYGYGAESSTLSDSGFGTTTYASTTGAGRLHVVKKKETLSSIAHQYYGVRNWRKIYEANRDRINDPNVIYPGMELVIP